MALERQIPQPDFLRWLLVLLIAFLGLGAS